MSTDDLLVKAYERYSIGYVDPREQWESPSSATVVAAGTDLRRWDLNAEAMERAIERVPVDMPISDGKRRLDLEDSIEVSAPLQVGRKLDFGDV